VSVLFDPTHGQLQPINRLAPDGTGVDVGNVDIGNVLGFRTTLRP
jgi:hypothetical protein